MTSLTLRVFGVVTESKYSGKMPLIHPHDYLSLVPSSSFGRQQAHPLHTFISVSGLLLALKESESSWKIRVQAMTKLWVRCKPGRISNSGMSLACASVHSIGTAAFVCGFLLLFNKASWKGSKAIMWHYFHCSESAATWKLCIYGRHLFYVKQLGMH